jgi:hypothetical protein
MHQMLESANRVWDHVVEISYVLNVKTERDGCLLCVAVEEENVSPLIAAIARSAIKSL